MKSVLLTGANGFLGQHLTVFLNKAGYKVIAAGRGESRLPVLEGVTYVPVDLTEKKAVEEMLGTYNPDVILHNAALSKPDECNSDRPLCTKTNVDSTKNLLRGATSHFIYVSTDFVFGENGPHAEDDKKGPLNFYGETKLESEQLVLASGKNGVIVRPVFIYGKTWQGMRPSFLHWVKNSIEQKKTIKVVSDQLRTPTYAEDICKGIERIIEKEITGVYHLAGKDILSPFEMAIKTAKVLQLDLSFIEEVTADTFPEPVKRAKRSGLKIEKAIRDLDYNPVSFEEGVRLTFE